MLRRHFGQVEWRDYPDTLFCRSVDDVVAFLTSAPPGQDASADQRDALHRAVARRFDAGGGDAVGDEEQDSSSPSILGKVLKTLSILA